MNIPVAARFPFFLAPMTEKLDSPAILQRRKRVLAGRCTTEDIARNNRLHLGVVGGDDNDLLARIFLCPI